MTFDPEPKTHCSDQKTPGLTRKQQKLAFLKNVSGGDKHITRVQTPGRGTEPVWFIILFILLITGIERRDLSGRTAVILQLSRPAFPLRIRRDTSLCCGGGGSSPISEVTRGSATLPADVVTSAPPPPPRTTPCTQGSRTVPPWKLLLLFKLARLPLEGFFQTDVFKFSSSPDRLRSLGEGGQYNRD